MAQSTQSFRLNEKQTLILQNISNGDNTFITGFAGSGKSYLIDSIISYFKNEGISFGITAMTGCASVLIGGITLHSFMGMGLGKGTPEEIIKNIKKRKGKIAILAKLKVLIIDEVSMLNDELFDKIAEIFRIIQTPNSTRPFGNVQLILVGDMSQLKPVEGNYCFCAKSWEKCNIGVTVLTENMRVTNDELFDKLLSSIRKGKITPIEYSLLESMKNTVFPDHIIPTKLFSINKDVDNINNSELLKLIENGAAKMEYSIKYLKNVSVNKKYTSSNKIPEILTLCIGAQVMVTRNIAPESLIVNGTRGTIMEFTPLGVVIKLLDNRLFIVSYFEVKSNDHEDLINFFYIPLTLSWAMSIHKSQGATIDALEIDLGDSIFAAGQAYVAISRARNQKSVKITDLSKRSIKTSAEVIKFYNQFKPV